LAVNGQDQTPVHYSQVTALKPSRPSVALNIYTKNQNDAGNKAPKFTWPHPS